MQTIVYQGLQSCFESQLIETTTLKLKVAAPNTMELNRGVAIVGYQEINNKKSSMHVTENMPSTNLDMGGWISLQSLSHISENEKNNYYIHPLDKRSPKLSQKSLELCTENLGSETGSENMEISILSLNSPNPRTAISSPSSSMEQKQPIRQMGSRNKIASRNFPPPLTTIRSSNSLQVRPHREDGRLIIEAIETPSRNTYLQAERSNGRLRLSFFNECAAECNHYDAKMIDEENEATTDIEYESEDEEYYEEQDDLRENDAEINGDFDINGIAKFQTPSRCKEGGHGNHKVLCNFKPLWVTTS